MTSLFHQLIVLEEIVDQAIKHYTLNVRSRGKQLVLFSQCLQILFMSRVTMTSASQILESFWNIWSQVSQRKKPFSDFPARGPGMYTLSRGILEVAVAVCRPVKLKSMMAV